MSEGKQFLKIESAADVARVVHAWLRDQSLGDKTGAALNEKIILARFLLTVSADDYFNFPMCVFHRDRPDFEIRHRDGSIGIEVTQGLAEQLARAEHLVRRKYPHLAVWAPSYFRPSSPTRSNREIERLLAGNPDVGLSSWNSMQGLHEEWVRFVLDVIEVKTEKSTANGFVRYAHNWLVIADRLGIGRRILRSASHALCARLQPYWKRKVAFDRVFLLSEGILFEFMQCEAQYKAVAEPSGREP